MESVARVAVISLERTKWVHEGCSGMKGNERTKFNAIYVRERYCRGEGRGP